jgi:glycosyltransferase involved in cell wall biosynthesis
VRVLFDLSRLKPLRNGSTTNAAWSAYSVALARPAWDVGILASPELRNIIDGVIPHDVTIEHGLPDPDLVHVPHQLSIGELSYLRGQFSAKISVAWLDFIATRRREYHKSDVRWLQSQRNSALALENVDGIVWLSDHVKNQAAEFGWGQNTPSRTVTPGIDHIRVPPSSSAIPSRLQQHLGSKQFCVLIAAALPHKNRLLAIESFLQTPELQEVCFVLGGGDPDESVSTTVSENELIQQHSAAERVVNLGPVSDDELVWLYRNALFSVAVADEEGFGIVPFESAFLGCACVTAPGATAVTVDNSLAATRTDAGALSAAFRLAATKPHLREESIKSFCDAAQQFTWSQVGEQTAAAFEYFDSQPNRAKGAHHLRLRLNPPKYVHKLLWELHPSIGQRLMRASMLRKP